MNRCPTMNFLTPCMLCPPPQYVFRSHGRRGHSALGHFLRKSCVFFSPVREREVFFAHLFFLTKINKKLQVLRPPPPSRHQLPQEEVRSHQPAPPQEEAEVERWNEMERQRGRRRLRVSEGKETLPRPHSWFFCFLFRLFFCRFFVSFISVPLCVRGRRGRESGPFPLF